MPNNKFHYLVKGSHSLLQALLTEVQKVPQIKPHYLGHEGLPMALFVSEEYYRWVDMDPEDGALYTTKWLTLPKDWDQLMAILDSLKQPKVQTLPTTSQGIPYLRVQHTIHMGIDPVTSLHIGTLKQWKKLGITTLTLPCGTLTQEDLTKLASL